MYHSWKQLDSESDRKSQLCLKFDQTQLVSNQISESLNSGSSTWPELQLPTRYLIKLTLFNIHKIKTKKLKFYNLPLIHDKFLSSSCLRNSRHHPYVLRLGITTYLANINISPISFIQNNVLLYGTLTHRQMCRRQKFKKKIDWQRSDAVLNSDWSGTQEKSR